MTICGHERDLVKWACCFGTLDPSRVDMLFDDPESDPKHVAVVRAVRDPAKLVEMLAARGRELGLSAMVGDGGVFGADDLALYTVTSWGSDGAIDLIRDHNTLRGWDMRDARSILLQWLQLPDGAREEALLALGVTT